MLKNKVVVIYRAGGAVSSALAGTFSRRRVKLFLNERHRAPCAVAKKLSKISRFVPVASAIVAASAMFASLEFHEVPATQIVRATRASVELQRSWTSPASEPLTGAGLHDIASPPRGLEILAPAGDGWG